jgi:hypothetical protein
MRRKEQTLEEFRYKSRPWIAFRDSKGNMRVPHLEITLITANLIQNCRDELADGRYTQPVSSSYATINGFITSVLDYVPR